LFFGKKFFGKSPFLKIPEDKALPDEMKAMEILSKDLSKYLKKEDLFGMLTQR